MVKRTKTPKKKKAVRVWSPCEKNESESFLRFSRKQIFPPGLSHSPPFGMANLGSGFRKIKSDDDRRGSRRRDGQQMCVIAPQRAPYDAGRRGVMT